MGTSKEYILQMAMNTAPVMAYKDDMDLSGWQKTAREKLTELLGLPLQNCEKDFKVLNKQELNAYIKLDFEFQSEPGYYVPCSLLVPKGVDRPLPGVICLQGHSTGAHISLGISKFEQDAKTIAGGRDFAVRAIKEGFCAIVMEQRYMGIKGQNEDGKPACITDNAAMGSFLMGRTAIGERVWDIARLVDVIEEYLTDYIDTDHIICMGNSGGGTATFYASCYDERIHMSIPSCAVCTYEESIMAMYHCPCNLIPGVRKYFNMGDLGCLIAPRALIVVCGKEDTFFPLPGVLESYKIIESVYKEAGEEELCHLVIGNGGHQFYPDEVWPIVKKILQQE